MKCGGEKIKKVKVYILYAQNNWDFKVRHLIYFQCLSIVVLVTFKTFTLFIPFRIFFFPCQRVLQRLL